MDFLDKHPGVCCHLLEAALPRWLTRKCVLILMYVVRWHVRIVRHLVPLMSCVCHIPKPGHSSWVSLRGGGKSRRVWQVFLPHSKPHAAYVIYYSPPFTRDGWIDTRKIVYQRQSFGRILWKSWIYSKELASGHSCTFASLCYGTNTGIINPLIEHHGVKKSAYLPCAYTLNASKPG